VPRAIWKGSIGFGLVNVPVAMYAAIQEQDLHFHMVHTEDLAPIGYQKICKEEEQPVPSSEIARAYELDDGTLVLLDDEDFEAAKAEGYHAITVLDFVPYDEIDSIYFERTFYLGPQDEGPAAHVYALLARAMEDAGLSAICSYVFHNREQLGCLRVRDGVLLLEKMYFADEVREADEHRPAKAKVAERELEMARQLIDRMAGSFDISRYHDSYREALLEVIEKKAKGKKVERPKAKREEAPDLMSALEASLAAATGNGKTRRSSRGNGGSRKSADGLDELTVDELRERAAKEGVRGRSKMSKEELLEALS
jgi:DNA end-binding protein Ku